VLVADCSTARLLVPAQRSLGAFLGSSNGSELRKGDFVGVANIALGSAQLGEVLALLIARSTRCFSTNCIGTQCFLTNCYAALTIGVAYWVEPMEGSGNGEGPVVSAAGDRVCADFVWRSAGLVVRGFPSELAVRVQCRCVCSVLLCCLTRRSC
jgi:hypothetical protein